MYVCACIYAYIHIYLQRTSMDRPETGRLRRKGKSAFYFRVPFYVLGCRLTTLPRPQLGAAVPRWLMIGETTPCTDTGDGADDAPSDPCLLIVRSFASCLNGPSYICSLLSCHISILYLYMVQVRYGARLLRQPNANTSTVGTSTISM